MRTDWFIGTIFSFFKRKSPLGRFGECPLLMEERTLSVRGLRVGLSPISDIAQLFHISAAKPVSAPTKVLI
jgi:hypothetical protein